MGFAPIGSTLKKGSIYMPSGDESVLLTGATGLVGGAVLSRLAARDRQRVYCLVRARTGRSPASRIAERLGDQDASTAGNSTIVPITGDVTYADLGLAQEVRATLNTKIETIVHCAANTSFLASADSWSTNTEGTRNLLALASTMPNLKQFIFIGSAASSISDANVEVDEDAPVSDPTHFVEYTKTKQAAEQALLVATRELSESHHSTQLRHSRRTVDSSHNPAGDVAAVNYGSMPGATDRPRGAPRCHSPERCC